MIAKTLWIIFLTVKPVERLPVQQYKAVTWDGYTGRVWDGKPYCTASGDWIDSKGGVPLHRLMLPTVSSTPVNLAHLAEEHPCHDATVFAVPAFEVKP